jgi:hypothetical protein
MLFGMVPGLLHLREKVPDIDSCRCSFFLNFDEKGHATISAHSSGWSYLMGLPKAGKEKWQRWNLTEDAKTT